MQNVLVTGAAGKLGSLVLRGLKRQGFQTRSSDINALPDRADEDFHQVDLRDGNAVAAMMDGVDAIVHFGAIPVEDEFGAILESNIRGTYNVFEAAQLSGVRRIVFASSNHVVGFHRRSSIIDDQALHRPDSYYGISKAFGEDLGRFYADKYGLGVLCLRIGTCLAAPRDARHLSTWISERDLVKLVCVGLKVRDLHFEVVYGISNNDRAWWDNRRAYELGYQPQDNAETYAAEILSLEKPEDVDDVAHQFQGGVFTSAGFNGDVQKID